MNKKFLVKANYASKSRQGEKKTKRRYLEYYCLCE